MCEEVQEAETVLLCRLQMTWALTRTRTLPGTVQAINQKINIYEIGRLQLCCAWCSTAHGYCPGTLSRVLRTDTSHLAAQRHFRFTNKGYATGRLQPEA
jgi:hypothetical protein